MCVDCDGDIIDIFSTFTMSKNTKKSMMSKELQIRNSTADFLVFTRQNGENGIAVRVEDENSVCRKFRQTAEILYYFLANEKKH
jgi:hypothetical protein